MAVCVKRSSTPFSSIAKSQLGQCSATTQKTCGNTAQPDTVICVGLSEPCPVYDIQISNVPNLVIYPASDWSSVNLQNGKILYFNNKGSSASSLPMSEFRFTQAAVCTLDNQASKRRVDGAINLTWLSCFASEILPSGQTDYFLVNSKRSSCSSTDSAFTEIIQLSVTIILGLTTLGLTLEYPLSPQVAENLYYKLNLGTAVYTTMSVWPNFPMPTSTQLFKTFKRNFIPWRISERS